MNRRLTLKSETLAELTNAELGAVAGAGGTLLDCLTGHYPSINANCNSDLICYQVTSLHRACPTDYCTGTTSV